MDGFRILNGVIPEDEVDDVRDDVEAAVSENRQRSDQMQANVRARGHRIGATGVASTGNLITRCPGLDNSSQTDA